MSLVVYAVSHKTYLTTTKQVYTVYNDLSASIQFNNLAHLPQNNHK